MQGLSTVATIHVLCYYISILSIFYYYNNNGK